ncbi:hypothetical protein TP2_11220 [Thioclava pacifica DSM 10166]|uniref:Uncharacterized protein n=1 Tax=Thioclava pacifica DSM 10166 TaxID=1353537 RepID=A0A074JRN8_9RHOB|nr:hypothetical protein TP2_11220 [Thioclava pacifica DSM 10166]
MQSAAPSIRPWRGATNPGPRPILPLGGHIGDDIAGSSDL